MPKTRHSFSRDRCRDRKKKRNRFVCMGLSNWQQCLGVLFASHKSVGERERTSSSSTRNIAYMERVGLHTSSKDYCVHTRVGSLK